MKKTILVLGADGYYGWPLAMKLAVQHRKENIILVDNEWRRNTVRSFGYDSLIPISKPERRLEAFREIHDLNNISYRRMDVNSDNLEELIESTKPYVIYHLAQQASAPYSMKGLNEALYTLNNNEAGNMRLLWAVRKHVPDAHIIKMGSFGEYAKGGIDISEGYFFPEHNGKKADRQMPYPREADDIYHTSKINDTNYVSLVCRKWNLRITDVMQSTIFGFITEEMAGCEELFTRFDYDEYFGTVVNRFLTQVVAGHTLTVYGTGHQRTGLMALRDSVTSLASFTDDAPPAGTHRVINHVTESNYSINELAQTIKTIAGSEGYIVNIKNEFDPRNEKPETKHRYGIETGYVNDNIKPTPFKSVVKESLEYIEKYKHRILERVFAPKLDWDESHKNGNLSATPNKEASIRDEKYWKSFKDKYFPSSRINLNPGTFGTTSLPVRNILRNRHAADDLEAFPLGIYEDGRKSLYEIHDLCSKLWPSKNYELMVTHGVSVTINLISLSMLRKFHQKANRKFKIVTTTHEHNGGIGCFNNLTEYEVHCIEDDVFADPIRLRKTLRLINPDIAFFSHVFYDTGNISNAAEWCKTVKEEIPECKVILDAAQSLGLYDIPFGDADVVIGSIHKWLSGPHGGGLLWLHDDFYKWIEGLYWNGNDLAQHPNDWKLSIQGGQDFVLYAGMAEALRLYQQVGKRNIIERSSYLAEYMNKKLGELFCPTEHEFKFLNDKPQGPVVALGFTDFDPYPLYKNLNEHRVHLKCIKNKKVEGKMYNILRFGLPYYEMFDNLDFAINKMGEFLKPAQSVAIGNLRKVNLDPKKPLDL